jgi:hypothetical protein
LAAVLATQSKAHWIELLNHRAKASSRLGAFLVAGVLVLCRPRTAKAENSLSYEYEDYSEPDGRVGVTTQTARIDQDLGTDMHVVLSGVTDAIAGATPSGQPAPTGSDQVVLSELHNYRKAWEADFSRQMPDFNVAVGFSRSIEDDYESNGWSVNTLTDFNRKNTTLLVGVAGTDDDVEIFFTPAWRNKHATDYIVGVTQLIDPHTFATLDFTWSRFTGMLDDPYKVVQKSVQVLPGIFLPVTYSDNRGDTRDKGTLYASIDHDFSGLNGAIEGSYRFYADTYGITSSTIELAWLQRLGRNFILKPDLRLYEQGAADFYYYDLDATPIVPTRIPDPQGPHYSSDARLSAFDEAAASIKLIWKATDWLQVDASIGGYTQHGRDGVTPQTAYYKATITTAGMKVSW